MMAAFSPQVGLHQAGFLVTGPELLDLTAGYAERRA